MEINFDFVALNTGSRRNISQFTYHDSCDQRQNERNDYNNCGDDPSLGEHVLKLLQRTHQEAGTVPNIHRIVIRISSWGRNSLLNYLAIEMMLPNV